MQQLIWVDKSINSKTHGSFFNPPYQGVINIKQRE